MNNIIEKLGITEIECWIEKIDHDVNHCVEDMQKVKELEQQRDEMLEALINVLKNPSVYPFNYCNQVQEVIEKVTGLSWNEIKELIDE